jgi:Asp-tRNA(Asn)/Glu-tRNA(Gln) amidotransferase A subunit family amidase
LTPLPPTTPRPGALSSFSEWLDAPPFVRKLALPACLERIRALDDDLQAWVRVSPQPPLGDGPLFGIPIGVKDIFETEGLATEYGSDIYKGRVGTADAAIVRELRGRGAIVMGKTQTAAFAYRTPAPTRNPHNRAHTPGGSSSGSAAAVAAGMIPLALGTQTKGSVLRPASYCGITGFKPTFGLISTEGVLPFAKSLDTVGFFAHTPADMLAFWRALGHAVDSSSRVVIGAPQATGVEPVMAAAFEAGVTRLREAGLDVRRVTIRDLLGDVATAADVVMFFEAAQVHGERYDTYGDRLLDVADAVRKGRGMSRRQYDAAREALAACRAQLARVLETTPIIATPAATGPAPAGLGFTGDPAVNAPWTALGTPAIAVPLPVSEGLPLGLQLTAAQGQDARLLDAACRIHDILRL